MHLDALGYLGLIADQVSQPRLERIRQGPREGCQQYPPLGVAARLRFQFLDEERGQSIAEAMSPREARLSSSSRTISSWRTLRPKHELVSGQAKVDPFGGPR